MKDVLPTNHLLEIWNKCCSSVYQEEPVWVYGDIAPSNILCENHHFYGLILECWVIKGIVCDYAMAWTYFDKDSRHIFLNGLSDDMINRTKGWVYGWR